MSNPSYDYEVEAGRRRWEEPNSSPDNASEAAALFLILFLLVIMTMNGRF